MFIFYRMIVFVLAGFIVCPFNLHSWPGKKKTATTVTHPPAFATGAKASVGTASGGTASRPVIAGRVANGSSTSSSTDPSNTEPLREEVGPGTPFANAGAAAVEDTEPLWVALGQLPPVSGADGEDGGIVPAIPDGVGGADALSSAAKVTQMQVALRGLKVARASSLHLVVDVSSKETFQQVYASAIAELNNSFPKFSATYTSPRDRAAFLHAKVQEAARTGTKFTPEESRAIVVALSFMKAMNITAEINGQKVSTTIDAAYDAVMAANGGSRATINSKYTAIQRHYIDQVWDQGLEANLVRTALPSNVDPNVVSSYQAKFGAAFLSSASQTVPLQWQRLLNYLADNLVVDSEGGTISYTSPTGNRLEVGTDGDDAEDASWSGAEVDALVRDLAAGMRATGNIRVTTLNAALSLAPDGIKDVLKVASGMKDGATKNRFTKIGARDVDLGSAPSDSLLRGGSAPATNQGRMILLAQNSFNLPGFTNDQIVAVLGSISSNLVGAADQVGIGYPLLSAIENIYPSSFGFKLSDGGDFTRWVLASDLVAAAAATLKEMSEPSAATQKLISIASSKDEAARAGLIISELSNAAPDLARITALVATAKDPTQVNQLVKDNFTGERTSSIVKTFILVSNSAAAASSGFNLKSAVASMPKADEINFKILDSLTQDIDVQVGADFAVESPGPGDPAGAISAAAFQAFNSAATIGNGQQLIAYPISGSSTAYRVMVVDPEAPLVNGLPQAAPGFVADLGIQDQGGAKLLSQTEVESLEAGLIESGKGYDLWDLADLGTAIMMEGPDGSDQIVTEAEFTQSANSGGDSGATGDSNNDDGTDPVDGDGGI